MRIDARLPATIAALVALAIASASEPLPVLLPGVVLAAALATLTLERLGRRAVGIVAALTGLGMIWVGFAARSEASGAALAYGLLGAVVATGAAWWVAQPPARRRVAPADVSGEVTDPVASWKAMDDGVDPTDEGERA